MSTNQALSVVIDPVPVPTVPPVRIAGRVVDDRNVPVAGAELKFYLSNGPVVANADVSGVYEVNLEARAPGLEVALQAPGYESSWFWLPVSGGAEASRDFRLHQTPSIRAGDSLPLSITPEDPWCGFDLEYRCRRIQVRSPAAGTLSLEAVPERPAAALGIVIRDVEYPTQFRSSLSIPVSAGSETPVVVLLYWRAGRRTFHAAHATGSAIASLDRARPT